MEKRLTSQVNDLRKEIGKLGTLQNKTMRNELLRERPQAKYNIEERGFNVVIEEFKQRVTAQSAKIKRYESGTVPPEPTF